MIKAIAERYQQKYDRELAADVESEIGGNLRKALLRWLAGKDCTDGLWYLTEQPMPTDDAELEERVQQLNDEQEALRRCIASWDSFLIQKATKGLGTDEKVSIEPFLCVRQAKCDVDVWFYIHTEHY